MLALAAIVGGYVSLIWMFGWAGLLVGLIHIAVMAAGLWRRP